jgi:hypothetical protein
MDKMPRSRTGPEESRSINVVLRAWSLLPFGLLLVAGEALAQDPFEIQVYDAEVLPWARRWKSST